MCVQGCVRNHVCEVNVETLREIRNLFFEIGERSVSERERVEREMPLTDKQKEEIEELFFLFDRDFDDSLNAQEFATVRHSHTH